MLAIVQLNFEEISEDTIQLNKNFYLGNIKPYVT